MEDAIKTVAAVFLKSSRGKDGLTESNFQKLVKTQLSNIMTDTDSKAAISNLRQGLDADQDKKVGFGEYMTLIGYLAKSLSEQRAKANDEVAQKADAEQPQSALPLQNAENQQGKEEAKAGPKVETNAEVKPEPAKEEEEPAAVAAVVAVPAPEMSPAAAIVAAPENPAAAVEVVTPAAPTNESTKEEESETVEIPKAEPPKGAEEEEEGEEKKPDEATS